MVRQHFYYHFEDIYDLVRWMFQEEAVSLLKRQEGALLWQEGLLQLFQYLQENRAVCLCALNSLSRPHLKRLFFSDIHAIIRRSVTQITDFLGCSDDTEPEMFTHFYVIALAGLVESWLLGEIDKTPGQLIQFTDTLIQNQIRGAAVQLQEQASGYSVAPASIVYHTTEPNGSYRSALVYIYIRLFLIPVPVKRRIWHFPGSSGHGCWRFLTGGKAGSLEYFVWSSSITSNSSASSTSIAYLFRRA